jgi:hypothetical protein
MITLDADLQNPPEEIGNLVAKMREGYDYVGSIRRKRQDSAWRTYASKAMNHLRERITNIKITDQGNMLRAYGRNVIDLVNQCAEVNTFVPALAYRFARNPTEIIVEHEERAAGESKYSLYSLIRLNFDLVTGFSLVPLQFFSMMGILLSLAPACWCWCCWCAACSSAPRRKAVHAVRDCLLLHGRDPVRHRPAGRIRRPHLPAGARASALRGADHPAATGRASKPAAWKNVPWAVRMKPQARRRLRLPQRRRALPQGAAGRRRRRRAGGHPRRQRQREHLVRIRDLAVRG